MRPRFIIMCKISPLCPLAEGDIRTFRQRLFDGEISLEGLRDLQDFWTLEGCRDLLHPVQEHRFTITQIEKSVEELGLEILGFEVADVEEIWLRKPAVRLS